MHTHREREREETLIHLENGHTQSDTQSHTAPSYTRIRTSCTIHFMAAGNSLLLLLELALVLGLPVPLPLVVEQWFQTVKWLANRNKTHDTTEEKEKKSASSFVNRNLVKWFAEEIAWPYEFQFLSLSLSAFLRCFSLSFRPHARSFFFPCAVSHLCNYVFYCVSKGRRHKIVKIYIANWKHESPVSTPSLSCARFIITFFLI